MVDDEDMPTLSEFDDDDDDPPPDEGPPLPEFDRDAYDALAIPGLTHDQRNRIIQEARGHNDAGMAREAVGNWICREVARTVGGPVGFYAHDAQGNVIDPPYVAKARTWIAARAGENRQTKRNDAIEQWRKRCRELRAKGRAWKEIMGKCETAVQIVARRACGENVEIPSAFQELPPIFGRKGNSIPDGKRLRKKLFGSASLNIERPTWANN
jgi:hypothetical protein